MKRKMNNWNLTFGVLLAVLLVYMVCDRICNNFAVTQDHLCKSEHEFHRGKIHTQMRELVVAKESKESRERKIHQYSLELKKAEERIKELQMLLSRERKKGAKSENSFNGHMLVHLDLKGAPPKMPYLMKLLSHFKEWGATGLLVEYEDMFPYSDDLEVLKTKHAYSKDDIAHFLEECENQNLMVVPLIQTFGHMEFVLKHKEFEDLREVKSATDSICPSKNGSFPLIKKMIDQVLQLHPKIKYIHVGGDEVYRLKDCDLCKADKRSKMRLFIDHMTRILKHINQKNLIPLMWHDMMRMADVKEIKELGTLMQPMVWSYVTNLKNHFPAGMWERFSAAFPKMWVASAFKGATRPDSNYVPIKHHLQNNMDWLDVIHSLPNSTTIEGIALTGWSRYNHHAALCELLPAGLPSLAFCLKALTYGEMNESLKKEVVESLGLPQNFSLEITPYKREYKDLPASFPGHEIFTLVGNLTMVLEAPNKNSKFIHLTSLKETLRNLLNQIYYEDTVEEWIRDKITAKIPKPNS